MVNSPGLTQSSSSCRSGTLKFFPAKGRELDSAFSAVFSAERALASDVTIKRVAVNCRRFKAISRENSCMMLNAFDGELNVPLRTNPNIVSVISNRNLVSRLQERAGILKEVVDLHKTEG